MSTTQTLEEYLNLLDTEPVAMPVLFVGHGSPMNAIEINEFTDTWKLVGKNLPTPRAILCISAHWETNNVQIQATECPKTMYDFYGFPDELFSKRYPAPGATAFAEQTYSTIKNHPFAINNERGYDHGVWSVLLPMFPKATIPVFQISLSRSLTLQEHFDLGKQLKFLREKGVLIVASGNIVHNLAMSKYIHTAYDWAIEFDAVVKNAILYEEYSSLINYEEYGSMADLAVPTKEHYIPLLYTLALKDSKDKLQFFNEKSILASISMRSFVFGRVK